MVTNDPTEAPDQRAASQTSQALGNGGDVTEGSTEIRELVYVCDRSIERQRAILAQVRAAGAEAFNISEEGSDPGDGGGRGHVALIGLDNKFPAEKAPLGLLLKLKSAGLFVIVYEDGIDGWNVAAKCRLLLAGACKVLDSSRPRFKAELSRTLREIISVAKDSRREQELIRTRMHEQGLIGASSVLLKAFLAAVRFSELSDLPVLITGESGTGKELLGRAIARMDPKRSAGPFVAVNCAAVPATMIESEVFGHRRGAFTGAERDRKGWIRAAEGGVLFLDEIGELDIGVQAKFLRVLQEHRVRGLGDDQDVAVKARFIAATNRNLEELASEKKFRNDLLNRLCVLQVEMPSLSQRPDDIPILVEFFTQKHKELEAHNVTGVSADYMKAVGELKLPGNVRQLENIVRQSLVNHRRGGELGLDDLPPQALAELAAHSEHAETAADVVIEPGGVEMQDFIQRIVRTQGWNLQITLQECERVVCREALKFTEGNQSKAARLLGITSRSVYNKVHKFGMRI